MVVCMRARSNCISAFVLVSGHGLDCASGTLPLQRHLGKHNYSMCQMNRPPRMQLIGNEAGCMEVYREGFLCDD